MESQFLLHTLFQPKHIDEFADELGSDDPVFKKYKLMEAEFSDIVDVMRQDKWLPLPAVNTLMTLLWRVVGNKIAPVAMNSNVPTLSFWCEIHRSAGQDRSLAVIMIPEKWHEMLVQDAHMQMGAMVFAASQAKDYWNHKFGSSSKKDIHDRAWSAEAELLHYFARTAPDFKANDYQKKIMERYPKGIASVDAHYVGREYDGVFPPFPVDINP
jgi:copper(I)-binding protein